MSQNADSQADWIKKGKPFISADTNPKKEKQNPKQAENTWGEKQMLWGQRVHIHTDGELGI